MTKDTWMSNSDWEEIDEANEFEKEHGYSPFKKKTEDSLEFFRTHTFFDNPYRKKPKIPKPLTLSQQIAESKKDIKDSIKDVKQMKKQLKKLELKRKNEKK